MALLPVDATVVMLTEGSAKNRRIVVRAAARHTGDDERDDRAAARCRGPTAAPQPQAPRQRPSATSLRITTQSRREAPAHRRGREHRGDRRAASRRTNGAASSWRLSVANLEHPVAAWSWSIAEYGRRNGSRLRPNTTGPFVHRNWVRRAGGSPVRLGTGASHRTHVAIGNFLPLWCNPQR